MAMVPTSTTAGGAKCGAQSKYTSKGMLAAAASDPSETKRQNQTTSAKRIRAANSASGQRAAKIPAAVATPLPPRKRSQMEKQWPSKTKIPQTTATAALSGVIRLASPTASQ